VEDDLDQKPAVAMVAVPVAAMAVVMAVPVLLPLH
jgi:hypothetical protein